MAITAGLGIAGVQSGVCTSTTRPAAPFEGQMIYETDTNRVLVWDNSAWVMIADTDTPPGLELINTTTVGSAVSIVTISNVFSSTYDNYRVVYSGGVGSVNTGLGMRVGGVSTNYTHVLFWASPGGSVNVDSSNNNAGQANYVGAMTTSHTNLSVDVLSPNLAAYTTFVGGSYAAVDFGVCTARHNIATAYTSVSILPLSGTITGGTIRVYGYRNTI